MCRRFAWRREVTVACLVIALVAAACGGGDDSGGGGGGGDAEAAAPTTTTTEVSDEVQILTTSADGLSSPSLDALVEGTYVLPGVGVTAAASSSTGPSAVPTTPGEAPATAFASTAGGYPGVSIQADPITAVTAAIAGGIEGIPEGIDLVVVGLNDGPLVGPLAGFDADIGVAQAAAAAGVPTLVLSAGLDEVPPDHPAALQQLAAWLDEHGAALRAGDMPAEVTVLSVPGCGFAQVRGVIEVPVATDDAGRDLNAVDCTSTAENPVDDIAAFTTGFATLSVLPAATPTPATTVSPGAPTTSAPG